VPPVFSLDLAQTATGGYVPGQSPVQAAADYAAYAAGLTNPAWQGIFEPVPLLDAKDAGVLGVVVAWTGMPDDEAAQPVQPVHHVLPGGIGPAVPQRSPVARPSGSATRPGTELAALAASGQATATLVLTVTSSVWLVRPRFTLARLTCSQLYAAACWPAPAIDESGTGSPQPITK